MTLQELFEARTFDLCRNLVHFLDQFEKHNPLPEEGKGRRGQGRFGVPDQSGVPAIQKRHAQLLRTLHNTKAKIKTMLCVHIRYHAAGKQISTFTLDPASRKVIFDQLLKLLVHCDRIHAMLQDPSVSRDGCREVVQVFRAEGISWGMGRVSVRNQSISSYSAGWKYMMFDIGRMFFFIPQLQPSTADDVWQSVARFYKIALKCELIRQDQILKVLDVERETDKNWHEFEELWNSPAGGDIIAGVSRRSHQ